MATVAIAGGGICGLAAALMLADDGHHVTVLERDPSPPPQDPESAFGWQRRGVGQFGLAHYLQPRGTAILRKRLPRAYQLLDENGALHFNLVKYMLSLQSGAEVVPDDDRFDTVTGRRSTLEWAISTAANEHPSIRVRRGEAVAGLLTGQNRSGSIPHVKGLRTKSGEDAYADLVVDATGRKSPTRQWLAAIGAEGPVDHGEDSGFVYHGRYLRSADGSTPALLAPMLSAVGSFSILTLPADNGTWSITLYSMSDDKPLRRFRDPEVFERIVRSCPLHRHWLDGEPVSEVQSMAGGVDRHREFVIDGRPCVTGMLSVADASSCTNPSLGRGISLGLMHVEALRECLADDIDDPTALALAFHDRTHAAVLPYHYATTAMDRRRSDAMRVYRQGGTPVLTRQEEIAGVLAAAATSDPVAARAYGDIAGLNALAEDVFAGPGVLRHILRLAETTEVELLPGPDRSQLVELLF